MMLTNNRIPLLALAVTAMAMLGAISVPVGRPAKGQGKSASKSVADVEVRRKLCPEFLTGDYLARSVAEGVIKSIGP